ncbi:hypothetical protein FRC09_014988 [Ceratobasidium sp. 395]|nr:hypothetical protein FRC09_014988 [Ceratobasidium sp. 395]
MEGIVREVPSSPESHERDLDKEKDKEKSQCATAAVQDVDSQVTKNAVNEPVTFKTFLDIISSPLTWLPAWAYSTTSVKLLSYIQITLD